MTRRAARLAEVSAAARISLLACVSAILLAGCGSDLEPTIPDQNAAELQTSLEGIQASIAAGRCDIALKQADDFKSDVFLLPASVEDAVKQGLFEVADQLTALIEEEPGCAPSTTEPSGALEEPEPTTTSTSTTSPTTTTTTTTTDTTSTDTTQPDSDDEDEAPPVEPPVEPPPQSDDDGSTESPASGGIGGEKGAAR